MTVILASRSPRRSELLKKILPTFSVCPADINEKDYPLEEIAYRKALKIAAKYPDATVIAADTFVRMKDKIYGKPVDEQDAFRILKELSSKTHEVTTFYAIVNRQKNIVRIGSETTYVTFRSLSDRQILDYIASGSPMDKAGAYGIQDNDRFHLISGYEGDKENVIGLPIGRIKKELLDLGIITEK